MPSPTILIIDDEAPTRRTLVRLFRLAGFSAHSAACAEEALIQLSTLRPDVILSDFGMPGMNGAEFLLESRKIHPLAQRFMLSAYTSLDGCVSREYERELWRFIPKPWDERELLAAVHASLEVSAEMMFG